MNGEIIEDLMNGIEDEIEISQLPQKVDELLKDVEFL